MVLIRSTNLNLENHFLLVISMLSPLSICLRIVIVIVFVFLRFHSHQHTHMSSSYRSSRLGLSHWDPYAMHRGGCLELYYCNTVDWCWWDSSLI